MRDDPMTCCSSRSGTLEQLNSWFEVALNNMARGLSMFDAEQRLIVCNKIYREIYELPEELTRPGTPIAGYRRYHVQKETGRDGAAKSASVSANGSSDMSRSWRAASPSRTRSTCSNGRIILVTNQPLADGGWVDIQEDVTEKRRARRGSRGSRAMTR